jgi:hypothetical protein
VLDGKHEGDKNVFKIWVGKLLKGISLLKWMFRIAKNAET